MKSQTLPCCADLMKVFGDNWSARGTTPPSKLARLQESLTEMTIARPASLLNHPGLVKITVHSSLKSMDVENVTLYTKTFLDALKRKNLHTRNAHFRSLSKA